MFLHYITEKHILNCPFMLSLQLLHEVVLSPFYRGGNWGSDGLSSLSKTHPQSGKSQSQDFNPVLCLVHSLHPLPLHSIWWQVFRCSPDPASGFCLPHSLSCILCGKRMKSVGFLVQRPIQISPFTKGPTSLFEYSQEWKVSILRDNKAWELWASVPGVRQMWLLSPVLPFASSGLKPRVAEYDLSSTRPPSQRQQ